MGIIAFLMNPQSTPQKCSVSTGIPKTDGYSLAGVRCDEKRLSSRLYKPQIMESCIRVQDLCESRGGRPGISVLTSLTVSVDVKQY